MATSKNFLELTKYIYENQPQLIDEMDADSLRAFIHDKAEAADKKHKEIFESGKGYQMADEIEHQALYEGLLFSPVSFVKSILNNEMGKDVTMAEAMPYYQKIKHIISEYETGDNFLGTPEEIELTQKIIDFLD